jgi:hypothetical protein
MLQYQSKNKKKKSTLYRKHVNAPWINSILDNHAKRELELTPLPMHLSGISSSSMQDT